MGKAFAIQDTQFKIVAVSIHLCLFRGLTSLAFFFLPLSHLTSHSLLDSKSLVSYAPRRRSEMKGLLYSSANHVRSHS